MRIEDMAASEPKRMSCRVGASMIVAVCSVQVGQAEGTGVDKLLYIRLAATALNGSMRQCNAWLSECEHHDVVDN
jgi:hypothetical protein